MRVNAFLPFSGKWKVVSIFAYSTKGLPGIDIKGLGRKSSLLKEKLIYLTRTNRIKVPLKRYVICVDLPREKKIDIEMYKWLELPVLLIFWHMLGVIPIQKLEDCFVAGSISTTGKVNHFNVKVQDIMKLNNILLNTYQMQMKYLAPKETKIAQDILVIPLESIFEGKKVYFKV